MVETLCRQQRRAKERKEKKEHDKIIKRYLPAKPDGEDWGFAIAMKNYMLSKKAAFVWAIIMYKSKKKCVSKRIINQILNCGMPMKPIKISKRNLSWNIFRYYHDFNSPRFFY